MKVLLLRFLVAMRPLLTSKKFQASAITFVIWLGARFGAQLDPETATMAISPLMMFILSQGVADLRKKTPCPKCGELVEVAITTEPSKEGGFVRFDTMCLILFVLAILVGACGWLQKEAKHVGADILDCVSEKAKAEIATYGSAVDAVLELSTGADGKVDKDKLADSTKGFAISAGACVFADAVARALNPKPDDPDAPKSSGLEVDALSLRAAFDGIAAERYGGKKFKTPHGLL